MTCAALATVLSASFRAAHADGYQVSYNVTDTSFNVKGYPSSRYYPLSTPFPNGCGVEMAFSGPSQSDARPSSASARFRLADASDRVASLGGPVSTTVTWQGSSSPPACVVLEQDCFVTWSGDSGVTGHCSNPLGGSATSLTPAGQSWTYSVYTVINNPGTTIPVPDCDPTADVVIPLSVQGAIGCECSVSVHPVSVNLNGTTPDASNNLNILIGQQCTSSWVGLPSGPQGTQFSYSWSIGDSDLTFTAWVPSTIFDLNASSYLDGPGSLILPTARWYWYWKNSDTETITGTVTVTPPANLGSSFTVTASNKVNVKVPGWTASGTGGQMQVNQNVPNGNGTDYSLYAGPMSGSAGHGMDWLATVTSPDPNLFGDGTLALCQLVTPGESYTSGSSTHNWSLNGQNVLDSTFPYPWMTNPPPPPYKANDSPYINLTASNATSATVSNQFTDYLMYQPPAPPGSNPAVCWVPLATFQWSTNGSANIPVPGGWAAFGSGSAGPVTQSSSSFTPSHSFPEWTLNVANGHF